MLRIGSVAVFRRVGLKKGVCRWWWVLFVVVIDGRWEREREKLCGVGLVG